MHIHFLGTCSGTEPMAGMHHCAWLFRIGNSIYWFDMGEGCSHTAYTAGIDLMDTRAIFVSHPHIDHVGGFANFLFCVMKLMGRYKKRSDMVKFGCFFPILRSLARSKRLRRDVLTEDFRFLLRKMRCGTAFFMRMKMSA